MSRFILEGGTPLRGDFEVAGMKNATTPLLASTILFEKPLTFHRVPRIIDVERMMTLLSDFGISCTRTGTTVVVDPSGIRSTPPSQDIVKRLRSSVLLLGPLLARFGKATLPTPGGCYIGNRPIDTHLDAFRQLGIEVEELKDSFVLTVKHKPQSTVILSEFSVTATENIVLYAALLEQTVTIKMAAAEPHVQDLCNFLVSAGVTIQGIGTHTLVVTGTKKLSAEGWTVIPDQIEIGTMAIAAAITQGSVSMHPFVADHCDALLTKFKQIGIEYSVEKDTLHVKGKKAYKHFTLQALPYPGFPTDLQAPMGLLATQAEGLSLIHDPMYDGRFSYIQELVKMGAQAVICDPHRVLISGKTKLKGEKIKSFDLRAGATVILAGLIAEGTTIIEDAEMVDRGYERFEERLASLGANITRANDE